MNFQTKSTTYNKRESMLQMVSIVIGTIFFFATNHSLTVLVPLFIENMGMNLNLVGICTGSMGLMTIITKFITPKLTSSFKLKNLIIADLFLLSAVTILFLSSKTATSVVVLRTLFGIPFSIFPILNLIAISRISSNSSELVKKTSLIGIAMPVSMMLAPICTEKLLYLFSYKGVFVFASACSILSFLFCSFGFNCNQPDCFEASSSSSKPCLSPFIKDENFKKTVLIIVAFFFLGVVDMLMLSYFPLLANADSKPYGFFFSLFSVSMVLSQYLYSKFSLKEVSFLIYGYLSLGLSIILTAINSIAFIPLSCISAVLFGLGYSFVETTTNTVVMKRSEFSNITISIQQLSVCLGRTLGPYCITLFSQSVHSLRTFFLFVGITMVIPLILSVKSVEKK